VCRLQAELRPQVFEEVRREVDPHLREVMARLQVPFWNHTGTVENL